MSYSLRSVFHGASVYTFGQLLTKASGFFLIPLYTRFLTLEDYGIVGYLQVFSQILATILMFGFYGAQTRYFYEFKKDKEKIGKFLFSINAYLIVVLVTCCLVCSLFGSTAYPFLAIEGIPFFPYIPIVIWTVFFQIMGQMVISYWLAAKDYKKCAFLQLFQFLVTTLSVIYFVVYQQQGALGQLKGLLAGQVIFFVFFYWSYALKFIFSFSWYYVQVCLTFGFPIVFHLLAAAIHNSVDRVILEKYVSMGELGIYNLGYQLGLVMSVITTSINRAWQPNYFEFMSSSMSLEQKKFETRRMLAVWVIGVGSICLIGMMWAREFLMLLTPERFHASAGVVPIILFGYFFYGLYFFAVSPFFQFKKTKLLPFLTAVSALLNIVLNFIFIPKYGIYGAAYATVFSFAFQAFFVYLLGKKIFYPEYEILPILISIFCFTFVVISIDFLKVDFITEILKFLILMIFVVSMTYFYKKYTFSILNKIYKRYFYSGKKLY